MRVPTFARFTSLSSLNAARFQQLKYKKPISMAGVSLAAGKNIVFRSPGVEKVTTTVFS